MNLDTPTVDQLRAMLALHEERAKVQRQLDAIDEKLTSLQSQIFTGGPLRQTARSTVERGAGKSIVTADRPPRRPAAPAATKAPRNEFKGRITEALTAVGAHGASLKELAEKLGTNYRNVAVWFATTGKKNPNIEKVGPARYRLSIPESETPTALQTAEESSHSGVLTTAENAPDPATAA